MNVLFIKPSSLGDIVHALPAADLLRKSFPDASISWLVNEEFRELARLCPAVNDVIAFRRKRWGRVRHAAELLGFLRELRRRRFDVAVDLQGLFRSGLMAFASGARRRIGFAAAREGAPLFYTDRIAVPENILHAVDKNVLLIRSAFQAAPPAAFPPLRREPETVRRMDELLKRHGLGNGGPLVAVAPAARWRSKSWPPAFFAAVMEETARLLPAVRFWLLGTADEASVGVQVMAACTHVQPTSLMGETTLGELIEGLRRSAVLLTNDSGPMHLAAAVERPVVALFGATDPRLTGPYGDAHVIFRGCCPQSPCFRELCPRSDSPCYRTFTAQSVAAAVAESARTAAPS